MLWIIHVHFVLLHILATLNLGKAKHQVTHVIHNREQYSKTRKPTT